MAKKQQSQASAMIAWIANPDRPVQPVPSYIKPKTPRSVHGASVSYTDKETGVTKYGVGRHGYTDDYCTVKWNDGTLARVWGPFLYILSAID